MAYSNALTPTGNSPTTDSNPTIAYVAPENVHAPGRLCIVSVYTRRLSPSFSIQFLLYYQLPLCLRVLRRRGRIELEASNYQVVFDNALKVYKKKPGRTLPQIYSLAGLKLGILLTQSSPCCNSKSLVLTNLAVAVRGPQTGSIQW